MIVGFFFKFHWGLFLRVQLEIAFIGLGNGLAPSRQQTVILSREDTTSYGASRLQLALQWRHNGRNGVSNHQPHDCLPNGLFRCRSKKTSKLRVTGLCAWNSPVTGEFPAQRASYAENVSIWWRHHGQWKCHYNQSCLQEMQYLLVEA